MMSTNTDAVALRQLREAARTFSGLIVAFSASWCKDCKRSIPILASITRNAGLEIRLFGGLVRDALASRWRVPPSPEQTLEFDIKRIPTIIVLDEDGHERGRLVENPDPGLTIEEHLLLLLKSQNH